MVARHCILKGCVQGVGFRYFTCRVAEQLGIKGWVRNLTNGDVEVYATGAENGMKQFMAEIQKGPSLALVEHIEVQDVELEEHQGFSIEG